jgi:acetyl esterase
MPLDPPLQGLLDDLAAGAAPPLADMSLEEARAGLALLFDKLDDPGPADLVTEDLAIGDRTERIPARLYRPASPGNRPPPILIWLHGGGFVLGDLETADSTARQLCAQANALVVSVDYPLAPEHRFPAAPEACYEATRWVADQGAELGGDPSRLAIGGDSAGGNLAAVTALLARDRGGPDLAFQLLVYPATDMTGSYPSVRQNGQGYLLTEDDMLWFREQYLPEDADLKDPIASPIYAPDLSGLPPALVITAEYDPLRDEGEAYAKLLEQAGVPVTASRYDGMIHGFFGMTALVEGGRTAVAEAAAALQTALVS